ncbi:MAG: hypothetical protein ACYC4H_04495 [Desulfocucumaceae bacterium]
MNQIISFAEKHFKEIEPIDYFFIIIVVLLSIPYIYKLIKRLYDDRIQSSTDLVKLKNDIISTQKIRAKLISQELELSRKEIQDKNSRLVDIAKRISVISIEQKKLSALSDMSTDLMHASINRIFASIFVTLAHFDHLSSVKSMIILYSSLVQKENYPDAPNALELFDIITEIEQKFVSRLPNYDIVNVESILNDPDTISSKFSSDNLELELLKLDELILSMEYYINQCSAKGSDIISKENNPV